MENLFKQYSKTDGISVKKRETQEKYFPYIKSLDKILPFAQKYFPNLSSLFEIKTYSEILALETILNKDADYCTVNNEKKNWYSASLIFYKNFLAQCEFFLNHAAQSCTSAKVITNATSRQVIYFGAPGTGKSHAVKQLTSQADKVFRTTFHPDYDYASFVGSYKPAMEGDSVDNRKIVYKFVPQVFINAYDSAWSNPAETHFLIIEEINRGNCAQIFGDIFQLLDRNSDGWSCYAIDADKEVTNFLASESILCKNKQGVIDKYSDCAYFSESDKSKVSLNDIIAGEKLLLPPNLFILATMNTSDQSLFPMDSAFKRRWDWKYVANRAPGMERIIVVNKKQYSWTSFITKINEGILELTRNADKQIGFWFIPGENKDVIDWKSLVSKAISYIQLDVVRDYTSMPNCPEAFKSQFAFETFFDHEGNPIADQVEKFLDTLNVEQIDLSNPTDSTVASGDATDIADNADEDVSSDIEETDDEDDSNI